MISTKQHSSYLKQCKRLDTLRGGNNRKRRILKELHDTQDGKCVWCGEMTYLWWERSEEQFAMDDPYRQATYEHYRLKSRGGKHTTSNGGCACAECNTRRKDIAFGSFRYVTADPTRYQKWKDQVDSRMSAKTAIKRKKREGKRTNQIIQIHNLAMLFYMSNVINNVDIYSNFMYNRRIIKSFGEHYGLL